MAASPRTSPATCRGTSWVIVQLASISLSAAITLLVSSTTGVVALEIDRLRLLEAQIGKLSKEIEELYDKLHPSDALKTIPGIGETLAPLVLGVLHETRRFAGLQQLRGFCGLFPRINSSGGANQPGQSITQSGNNRIKRALYLAADAARRIDPGLAEVYWRLMVRKGHHHKQALCAVATRLVNRIGKVHKIMPI